MNKEFCRNILNLPNDKKIILFASADIANKRKGFDVFCNAVKNLDLDEYIFIAFGEDKDLELDLPIKFLGKITNENFIPLVYNASDLFVIPSLEDNLPNTVLESLACGTPVIGSDVGGIPDMVRSNETGQLFEVSNSAQLAEKITEYFADSAQIAKMSENCRRIAVEEYDLSVQAKRYIELYEKIINEFNK